ncbi:MAG: DUF4227 domain-containing protein [Caldibacillus debilis]|uniref:DUF4227 domain-containing protein n=3 Tax=Caldibacillus debilis TaxID=301148 RepID=A0A420VF68_9BACI|nr:YqzK family protein [Caldibacillus debilis]MBO2483209.1 DUF4227 domain-containing protein [Bacillaceae bacterium]OUM83672.1 MAG: hypothetical protein BAA03_02125 [Caldibacillus debilis]REJ14161.1 MAG: DUF4227 domain-containing protein [Caldibacillus debilis]REJ24894.1 MAG: DUF4227 domain-containing protein [Caldibacillus debilis]REJ26973.1 MAG: DUF4227 domain-containing protein [Caldibacillus debilis]
MKKMLAILWQTLKVFILFLGCTIFFYYAMMWVNEEYQNRHRYDEPEGDAVKVSIESGGFESDDLFQRLFLFYLIGE